MSDTHGEEMKYKCVADADVAIHCGDLTEESELHEFKTTLQTLKSIRAPLKLVIAGNHDFTLDVPAFKSKLAAIDPPLDDALVKREYGTFGEARALFESEEAKAAGIHLLHEGTHTFQLANGSTLTVFASPYTCSLSADWGFQYRPDEEHDAARHDIQAGAQTMFVNAAIEGPEEDPIDAIHPTPLLILDIMPTKFPIANPLREAIFACFAATTYLVRPDLRRQLVLVGGAASAAHSSP
ncbi:hypothetical protein KC351_g7301 [Hortaea werneckii]|nr:hypothetical protein KC351_g7301 [Hortaea werneckii]